MDRLSEVKVNDMADVFPMIGEEWSTFVADVAAQGVVNPIVWSTDGSTLVDGRNRLRAWLELGNTIESCPSRRLAEGEDEYAFIISANIARRSMNKGQLVMAAARAYPLYAERARVRMLSTLNRGDAPASVNLPERGRANDEAANAFRVSGKYVDDARKMISAAPADMTGRVSNLIAKVEAGELSMNAARTMFAALDFTPSKLTERPGTPLQKTIEDVLAILAKADLDSASTAVLINSIATKIGMTVVLTPRA